MEHIENPESGAASSNELREMGVVSLVQLQPVGLIVDGPEEAPTRSFYDVSRRVEVDQLVMNQRGVEATLRSGEHVLDIHHLDHPDKAYDEDDLVCIGFTSHYEAMRGEFGGHMVDGAAGENIIIERSADVWPEDLGNVLLIENQDTGELASLTMVGPADPCVEFSRFCIRAPHEDVPASRLGEILRFLGRGRRGYLLVLDHTAGDVTVRPGDRVFVADGISN